MSVNSPELFFGLFTITVRITVRVRVGVLDLDNSRQEPEAITATRILGLGLIQ